jgi:PTH1 family peptidyl-tRNA hydrolase
MVLDALAWEASGIWSVDVLSSTCRAEIAGHPVLLVKPSTFMNLSGKAVQALISALEKGPRVLLLVVDDLNLPFGRIRVRERGSDAASRPRIIRRLGTDEICAAGRNRREQMPEDKAAFVLSDFPPKNRRTMK